MEKYGNKILKLLHELEYRINTKLQIGGDDGIIGTTESDGTYIKLLSYSVNHKSYLVHMDRVDVDGNAASLEAPQIMYKNGTNQDVIAYTIDQQLRLGCDHDGYMYKYSTVLTFKNKKRFPTSEEVTTAK
jgi:hypothetical protein